MDKWAETKPRDDNLSSQFFINIRQHPGDPSHAPAAVVMPAAAGAVAPVLTAIGSLLGAVGGLVTLLLLAIFMLLFGRDLVAAMLAEASAPNRKRYDPTRLVSATATSSRARSIARMELLGPRGRAAPPWLRALEIFPSPIGRRGATGSFTRSTCACLRIFSG